MTMTPTELKEYVKKHNIKMIDAKFVDFLGQWKHLTYPIERLGEGLEDGFGFDGSSVAGWRAINSSDMLMRPDISTAIIDPFLKTPTLAILCDVVDPITHEAYTRCPRSLAKRAVAYLKSTGVADTAYFGPEAEFFIFDSIQYTEEPNHAFFQIDSDEAGWNTKRAEGGGNKGFKPPTKGGYCVVGPTDQLTDLRTQMVMTMQSVGIVIETHHHEVASAGQAEIDMKYDTLVKMADQILWYKHIVKNVARAHGKTATFMPKPLFGFDNGSGMHTAAVAVEGPASRCSRAVNCTGMSEITLFYIGGLLKHAGAICAFANPANQQLSPAGPGLRGAGQLRRTRHTTARPRSGSRCTRASPKAKQLELRCAGYVMQSVPRVRGDDDGRSRRHQEPDPPRRAARQGYLLAVAGGARRGAHRAGLAGRLRSALAACGSAAS